MEKVESEIALKRKSKTMEMTVDSDDEPIGTLLKVQSKRNLKKSRIVADDGGNKANGVEKMTGENEEIGGMDDTLANFRKKLKAPKKFGRSTVGTSKDLSSNALEQSHQSRNVPAKDRELETNLIESKKRSLGSTEGGSSVDTIIIGGLIVDSKTKNKRSKFVSDASIIGNSELGNGFFHNRSGNDALLEHEKDFTSESEIKASVDSLSTFYQKMQPEMTGKSRISSRLKEEKEVPVCEHGSKSVSCAVLQANIGKSLSASEFAKNSFVPDSNCRVTSGLPEVLCGTLGSCSTSSKLGLSSNSLHSSQMSRSIVDVDNSSTEIISENSAHIPLLHGSPSSLRTWSGKISGLEDVKHTSEATGDQLGVAKGFPYSPNILDDKNEASHSMQAQSAKLPRTVCEGTASISDDVKLVNSLDTDSSQPFTRNMSEEVPYGTHEGTVEVLGKSLGEKTLAPLHVADDIVYACEAYPVLHTENHKCEEVFQKHKDDFLKELIMSDHVLESSPVFPVGACILKCDHLSEDEEANGICQSPMLDDQGSCQEDRGSPADTETKESYSSVGQRAVRNVKKHRHGDMAYEGDIDWEGLMQGQEFFSSNQIVEKPREKLLSSFAVADAENGKTAAVTVGLKARGVGALEKIKFKEILKRKGGLQEYLECRNHILSFWNKDVSRILPLVDFGVSETPVASEDTHASLIRDIYTFLDQYGYINFGVPSPKEMIENCIKPKELLTDEKFVGNSGIPLPDSDNGVSSCLVKAEGSEIGVRGNGSDAFADGEFEDRGVTEHGQVDLEILNSSASFIAEGYPINNFQQIQEPKPLEIATGSEDFVSSPCSKVESEKMAAALNPSLLPADSSASTSDCAHSDMMYDLGSRKNVIVVGAGPAGLTAARHLQRHGFTVTVLEARSRIGGRVFTDRSSLSVPVDLGASIITGVEADVAGERRPDPSSLICAQLGLELTVLNSECPLYDTVTGQKVPPDVDEALEAEYNSLLDDMVMVAAEKGDLAMNMSLEEGLEYELKGRCISLSEKSNGEMLHDQLKDISLGAERLSMNDEISNSLGFRSGTLNPLERRVMDWHFAHLEYGCAALLKEVSLPNWNQDDVYGGFGGAHCMIKGGYSAVVESLGEGIHIQLDHAVSEISYQAECEQNNKLHKMVKVSTLNGKEFSGDAVLVTVPLGCLKAETIKFSPPLPQWKYLSIKRLGFGVLNKVVLEFPGVFWDDSIDYFGATAADTDQRGWCFMFWNVRKTVGAPVLIALVVGKAAIDGQNLNPSDHVSHALLLLRKLFGEENVPDPVASVVTDWGRDPYTYGAYSYVSVGSSGEDYDTLGRPVEKCLFFAGEATCKEHPDTVGGAMMSGLREAVRIIDILNNGTDCTAEAEAMEAAKRHLDIQRSEVKDIISQLDAAEFSSDLYNQSSDGLQVPSRVYMLRDMFFTAKTMAGRSRLAKELLNLPVGFLKTFASTKEGLSTLNAWILDSMGKDGTQLLRHCVRLLLLVSNDLLAVRLSGVGKTVKEKVCVHTSRDIRSIASQLVSVWVDLFRKEKARRGSMKYSGHSTIVNSKSTSHLAMRRPPAGTHHVESRGDTKVSQLGMHQPTQPEETWNSKEKIYGKADALLSESQGCLLPKSALEEESYELLISEEEKAAITAAEAARAAAIAAAKAYAASGLMQRAPLKPPRILSFHKFAMQEQHAHTDEFDGRRNWFGAAVGRQDYLSEIDSWNRRVRDWTVDFSATGVDVVSSKTLADDHSQQNQSNEVACQLAIRDHSGESVAVDSSILTKAWVDSSGSIGMKTYNAIERWQCQAAAASSSFSHGLIRRTHEEDSNKSSKSHDRRHNPPANETSTSQVTTSKESKGNQGRGTESIKHAVVDYVASLLMPLYKARKIDRDGYKSIMKKAATKVMEQATDSEKAMAVSEFLDYKRKNKIRAFVDILIERHMTLRPDAK